MAFEAMYAGSDNTWWSILDFSLAMFIAHMEGEEVEVQMMGVKLKVVG